jgi:ubiquinone/menaquinone biosynthesis C-methylase UbiE
MMKLSKNNIEKKVHEAYTEYADRIWKNGYRFNPVYIASKALSDWSLLTAVDLTNKRVLNIGCAEPIDEIQFVEKVRKWVALDVNEKLIKTAEEIARRKLHPNLFKKIEFVAGDASELPLEDNTFDIVVSFSTIEHIPERRLRAKALEEIARVTKRKGYVVVTVPNKWNLRWHVMSKRAMKRGTSDYGYCYNYSPLEIRRDLAAVGLKIIRYSSDYKMVHGLTPFNPLDRCFERFFIYFGERMGYLAQKP